MARLLRPTRVRHLGPVLLWAFLVTLPDAAVAQIPVTYVYDDQGRLIAVVDTTGEAAVYTYDEVGNLLSIARQSAGTLAIFSFTPDEGPTGAAVTIYGTGFSGTPAANTVRFNGVTASVVESSPTRLVATVPAGATTGAISVETAAGTATSSGTFTVTAAASAPTVTGFSPEIGPAGTAVDVVGLNFAPVPANNLVTFNVTPAPVTTASAMALGVTVPAGATSGRITVATPHGQSASLSDFYVPPPPFTPADVVSTGRLAYGESRNVAITAAGKVGLVLFDGTAGDWVNLKGTNITFTGAGDCSAELSVYSPTGALVASQCVWTAMGEFTGIPLPATGTYTVLVAAAAGVTGQMTLRLTKDVVYTTSIGGPPVTITIGVPDQVARVLFTGAAGQGVAVRMTGVTIAASYVELLKPDRTPLTAFPEYVDTSGRYIDAVMPVAGTYALVVDPDLHYTGDMTIELSELPPDVTGTIAPDGVPVTVTTTLAGQNARLTFDGSAGQRVSLLMTNFSTMGIFTQVSVLDPNGAVLMPPEPLHSGRDFREPVTLPANGTYTIVVDPREQAVGSVTLALYTVPPDVTGTIAINAPGQSFTIAAPGQNATYTFAGSAGQRITVTLTGVTVASSTMRLLDPGGALVVATSVSTSGGAIVDRTLTAAGTYSIAIDPAKANTGSMTLRVLDASDVLATIVPGGPPVTVTTTEPGQNAKITFEGTAGQRVSLRLTAVSIGTSTCCGAQVSIANPDGSVLAAAQSVGTNGAFVDRRVLPATGTYTILLDPSGTNTGSATLTLYDVPPDAAGALAFGGPASSVTIGTPGQNAQLTFTGAADQRVSLQLSGSTLGSTTIAILRPDGTPVLTTSMSGASSFIDATLLPVAGTYTVLVDPSGVNTGAISVLLHDATDVTGTITPGGPPVTVTLSAPGQNARLTFGGVTGQRVSLRLTAVTISNSTISILNPDGSTLASSSVGTSGTYIDTRVLAATGTYTLFLNPSSTNTGVATLTLYDVPPDATGTLTIGGPSSGVTITTPGQNGSLSFDGPAGQQIALQVTANTMTNATVAVLRPEGTTLASAVFTATGLLETTLPAAGSYTVSVNPSSFNTGSMTLVLADATDVTATIVPGGPAVTVTIPTAGQKARVTFEGAAGQRVSLRLTSVTIGTSSCCGATVAIANPDGTTLVAAASVGTSGAFIDTRVLPAAGTYTILLDPSGSNTGSATLTLYDVPPDVSGSIVAGGSDVVVSLGTPGQNAQLTFSGTSGQRVSLRLASVTIGTSTCCSATVAIRNPDGTTLVGSTNVGTSGAFIDTRVLPATGTYAILLDPSSFSTGSATLTLYDVPADVSGPIVPGGPDVAVSIGTPGQNAQLTFSATAGDRVSLKATGVTIGGSTLMRIVRPDGTAQASVNLSSGGTGFIDVQTLPATGTYTVLIDPATTNVGNATLTLYAVPADVTGPIVPGGADETVSIGTPGQTARLTFTAAAGQRVSLRATGTTIGGSTLMRIVRPDGTAQASTNLSAGSTGFIDTQTLAAAGTYTVLIDPATTNVGSTTLRLFDVVDVTGTVTIGGGALPVTVATPGQNASITFSGTASQLATVAVTGNTMGSVTVRLLRPDGTQLTSRTTTSASFTLTQQTLPTTGTYTITIDPASTNTGSLNVSVTSP